MQQQRFININKLTNMQFNGINEQITVDMKKFPSNSNSNVTSSSASGDTNNDCFDGTHFELDDSCSMPTLSTSCQSKESNGNENMATPQVAPTPSIGVNLRVTGQCSQGGRKYMEDYFSVAYQKSENAKDLEYAFIGIYDGHGGAEAATFAKEHLMMEIINQRLFWSDDDQDVLRAIREGYIATHFAMWREQENWPKTANGLLSTAGTTATIAFIRREKIYIGHVGDSGIVLGYQNPNENFWRSRQLTTDHKPESTAERSRIMQSGGKVVVKSGVPRVVWNRPRNTTHRGPIKYNTPVDEIPFLAVARSLGDLWSFNAASEEFVVSPDPDVQVVKIDPETFRCLIFGTDGLWNVVTAQDAVDIVYKKEFMNKRLQARRQLKQVDQENCQWTNPSKGLVEHALKIWSYKKMRADNTSVVTVILYPPQNSTNKTQLNLQNKPKTEFSTRLQDNRSFQEIADKYLAPEKFRNIYYFGGDKEIHEEEMDDAAIHYEPTDWHKYYNNNENNSWQAKLHENCSIIDNLIEFKGTDNFVSDNDDDDDEEDDDDDVGDDDDDDEEEEEEENAVEENNGGKHYTNYNTHYVETLIETKYPNMYMNSFAESYNSLLNAQISRDENTNLTTETTPSTSTAVISNSVNCPNNAQLGMQQILQEQQMYQQQCMSGEDGYMLTKLETRREQQRLGCSAVQTYKLNHHIENDKNFQETLNEKPTQSHNANISGYWERITPIYAHQQQQQQQQQQQNNQQVNPSQPQQTHIQIQQQTKLLELNSLLQQERDEEQQVALELQQQQQQQLRSKLQRLQGNETVGAVIDTIPINEQINNTNIQIITPEQSNLLDESNSTIITPMEIDETVQINEISSSSSGSGNSSSSSSCIRNNTNNTKNNFNNKGKVEKIEIKHHDKPEYKTKSEILLSKAIKSPYYVPAAAPTTRRGLINKIRQQFANIPNENKHEIGHHTTIIIQQNINSKSCTVVKNRRQLRSNNNKNNVTPINSSNNIDFYSKRTLRARNSLTKDLKTKTTLKRNSCGNIVTQLLNKTCNMCNNDLSTTQLNSHVINLRSRQINSNMSTKSHSKATQATLPTTQTTSITTATTNGNNKTVCVTRSSRNLRSNNMAVVVTTDNYSKPTRVQSNCSTLAHPPPSPKIFQSNFSTRSRTLLNKNINNSNNNNNNNIIQTKNVRTIPQQSSSAQQLSYRRHVRMRNVGVSSSSNNNNNILPSSKCVGALQSARNGRVQKRIRR